MGYAAKPPGHAFAITGYTGDGFIVQNSWGEKWGYFGFAVLTYKDWVENGSDAWVAVRGAPVNIASSPHTFTKNPLQAVSTDFTKRTTSSIGKAIRYDYEHDEVRPWSEEQAYRHSLVIGNDGQPKLTMVAAADRDASAYIICHDHIRQWLEASSDNHKIAIYAHGGLSAEEDSINRIRVMAPYFKANGIYPLFITWKTGFLESLTSQISDNMKNIFMKAGIDPAGARAKGIFDRWREPVDGAIENFSREFVVRGIWLEMKENARYASDRAVIGFPQRGNTRPGGMVILAKMLETLKQDHDFEIHLVGHSAGSILFGHWMDELIKRALPIDSLTLYAPACTLEFANRHYSKAQEKRILAREKISIHLMDDERELADNVGKIYGKSLLYLVSRALEDVHKMPLLGMAAAWNLEHAGEKDGKFNSVQHRAIKKWVDFAGKGTPGVNRFTYHYSDI